MEPRRIQITIVPGQGMTVKVINGQGSSCKDFTAALEQGAVNTSTELLPEYYQEPDVQQTISVDAW